MTPTRAAAVGASLVFLTLAPAARAEEVTGDELRRLAAAAKTDRGARARLLRVEVVDGAAVDLRRALAGARGRDLERRLDVLAEGPAPQRANAAAARKEARAILAERRFHRTELPRPLRGPLGWIGDRLRPVGDFLDDLFSRLPWSAWLALAAVVVAAATVISLRLARRRSADVLARRRTAAKAADTDPVQLEREAERAERRGDFERALRLLFRAGLLRLDRLGAISFRESVTNGEVARRLRSAEFERLAQSFDEIVYGRRRVEAEDVRASRNGWQRVLVEATRA